MKMQFTEQSYRDYPHHLDNPNNIKLIKRFRDLTKAEKKLLKARSFRIWVESNPKINLFTYFYYRIKERQTIKMIREKVEN